MSQEHYWKEFFRLKVHVNYLELHLGRAEYIDRAVKMFLAVTSGGSIGAWVIWKEFAFLWGFLIAASQVLNAIRQFLPYKDRLRSVSGLLNDMEELFLHMEIKWLDIAAGKLTSDETNKILSGIRSRRLKAIKKHFPSSVIPENKNFFAQAEVKARTYFDNFYGQENEHDYTQETDAAFEQVTSTDG
jgi:hypothetical protein